MVDVGEFIRQHFAGTPTPQPGLGQLAQAQPQTPPPQNQGERDNITQQWQQFLGNPDVRTALFQFGVSVLQPGLPLASRIGLAAGDAAQAVEAGKQQRVATEQQLFENQLELEEEERRRQRLGLEKARVGLEGERVGHEGERVGIARDQLDLDRTRVAQGAERINLEKSRVRQEGARIAQGDEQLQLSRDQLGLSQQKFKSAEEQQAFENERQLRIDELAFKKADIELELMGLEKNQVPFDQRLALAADKRAEAELEIRQQEAGLRRDIFEADQNEIKTFFDPATQTIVPATNAEAATRGYIPISGNVIKTTKGEFGDVTVSSPLGLPIGEVEGSRVGAGKPLPQDARDKFSAAGTALNLLDRLEQNVGQSGIVFGVINETMGKLGLNPAASDFTNASKIMKVVSQQLVPDRPSDFDARLVQDFLTKLSFTAEETNRIRIRDLRTLYTKLFRENLAFFKYSGFRIPDEILNTAKSFGINPESVKAWDGKGDPLRSSADFIYSKLSDEELISAAQSGELSERALNRVEQELVKRLEAQTRQSQ